MGRDEIDWGHILFAILLILAGLGATYSGYLRFKCPGLTETQLLLSMLGDDIPCKQ